MDRPVFSVVMAGGQGTRLWPLSRESQPKQFLSLTAGGRSLLQETVQRAVEAAGCLERVLVVVRADQSELVKSQIPELPEENLLLEPFSRNTAACIGLAAVAIQKLSSEAVMAVFPSDHIYQDEDAWGSAVQAALQFASRRDYLVAIGLLPATPFTGYGYMRKGRLLEDSEHSPVYEIAEFIEKPSLEIAQQFVESQKYLWNIGTFAWQVSIFQQSLEKNLPDTFFGLAAAGEDPADAERLAQVYAGFEDISVDYAVLERETRVAAVQGEFHRIDMGTLASLEDVLPEDPQGNTSYGQVLLRDSRANIIYTDQGLVGLIGLQDTIVIRKGDILLVCPKDRASEVKEIVRQLEGESFERYR